MDIGQLHAPNPHSYVPETHGYKNPHHNPYDQPSKYNENSGYSHVSLATPAYRNDVENYFDPPQTYGQHRASYGHNAKHQ